MFPDKYGASDLNYWQYVQRHTELLLTSIVSPSQAIENELHTINDYFVSLIAPHEFGNRPNNIIIQRVKSFENVCALLMKNGIQDPENLTVLRFNSVIKTFEDKTRK